MLKPTRARLARSALFILALTLWTSAQAASVRLVGFDELVRSSALIFHGVVVASASRELADGRHIVTDVEFEILDVYKGELGARRLTLGFAGGVVDGVGVRVHGLTQPSVGEVGVYFVEQTGRPQVNPLYGWDQGHYLVRRDDGGPDRVFTNRGLAVTAAVPAASPTGVTLCHGVPVGVTVAKAAPADSALSLSAFAATVRDTARRHEEGVR